MSQFAHRQKHVTVSSKSSGKKKFRDKCTFTSPEIVAYFIDSPAAVPPEELLELIRFERTFDVHIALLSKSDSRTKIASFFHETRKGNSMVENTRKKCFCLLPFGRCKKREQMTFRPSKKWSIETFPLLKFFSPTSRLHQANLYGKTHFQLSTHRRRVCVEGALEMSYDREE